MTDATATFGAGGGEPYARVLAGSAGVLYLHALDDTARMDVARWQRRADRVDRELLHRSRGPVLDIGCGPGRMVAAARDLGRDALGIDVSPAVVRRAIHAGLPVIRRSVFDDDVPAAGEWRTILLIDGNIGIGGDPRALLARCRELLHPHGQVVVEAHPDPFRDRAFEGWVSDEHGGVSDVFPWAELGLVALTRAAGEAGLRPAQPWSAGGRTFCRLRTAR